MSLTETDLQNVGDVIRPLLGKRAWGASLGVGSFVTLEFGDPRPARGRSHPHGEWHLWVYCAAWRLERAGEFVAASEDPRELLVEAVRALEGVTLLSVEVRRPAPETVFTFDQEVALSVFPVFSREYEHWMLYTPDGQVLVVGPGSSWSLQPATQDPGDPPSRPEEPRS